MVDYILTKFFKGKGDAGKEERNKTAEWEGWGGGEGAGTTLKFNIVSPVIPIIPPPSFISFPGTVIVAALSSKFVPPSPIVFVITVTHRAVRGGLGPGGGRTR